MCFTVLTVIVECRVCVAQVDLKAVPQKASCFLTKPLYFKSSAARPGPIAWLARVTQEVLWRRCAMIAIGVPAYTAVALLHSKIYVYRAISRRFQLLSTSTVLTVSSSWREKELPSNSQAVSRQLASKRDKVLPVGSMAASRHVFSSTRI